MQLLLWILPAGAQHIPHLEWITPNTVRHSINCAKLCGEVALLAPDLHEEEGLVLVGDLHAVSLEEVVCYRDLCTISVFKVLGYGILIKDNIRNNVCFLVTPVSNDTMMFEFSDDLVLWTLDLITDLINSL